MPGKCKRRISAVAFALGVFALSSLSAYLALKHSGSILRAFGEKDFGAVFMSLSRAEIHTAIVLPLCLSAAAGVFAGKIFSAVQRPCIRWISAAFLALVSYAVITSACLCFSTVNGIKVIRVLVSLFGNLKHGLAEELWGAP